MRGLAHEGEPLWIQIEAIERDVAPRTAFSGLGSVGARVAFAEDQDLRVRDLGHQPGQGARKDVQAAQRLKVVVDVGYHAGAGPDRAPARQDKRLGLHRSDRVDVHALVDDSGHRPKRRRQGRGLEGRRRHNRVRLGVGEAHDRILGLGAKSRVLAGDPERVVESDVEAVPVIEEFSVGDQLRLRPDLPQEDGLAPSRMAHDYSGIDAAFLERSGDPQGGARADQIGLGPHREREDILGRASRQGVAPNHHAGQAGRGPAGDCGAGRPARQEDPREILELGRDVVVHEEYAGGHGSYLPSAAGAVTRLQRPIA